MIANLRKSRGGKPLARDLREFFEDGFGIRLNQVRIHHDRYAHLSNQALGSTAFDSDSTRNRS